MAHGMGYSRSENFGELCFLAGCSTPEAFQGLSLDCVCPLFDQTVNDRKPQGLAGQHSECRIIAVCCCFGLLVVPLTFPFSKTICQITIGQIDFWR